MKKLTQILEIAIEDGTPVLIEDMEDSTNPLLASVYKSVAIKKGRNTCMQLGDKEIVLNPEFKLFIHTKNSNLQYSPEIQADYTLINFTLTEQGLEDQILALVVNKEQSDLIKQKDELIQQQNKLKIKLQQLEDSSLHQLTNAEGSILDDVTLIESLESCQDISSKLLENSTATNSSKAHITEACEAYRPVAKKGALIFSLMSSLSKIHSFYKFSLDSFATITNRILDATREEANLEKRVEALGEAICYQVFNSTRRGLFEKHKLMFATMLCLRVLEARGDITKTEINVFVNREIPVNPREHPESLKFMPQSAWEAVLGLESLPVFENLSTEMEEKALEWRKWCQDEKTEEFDLPESYQDATEFQKLLLLRAMRPDRLVEALPRFIETKLGDQYIHQAPFDISQAYDETSPKTPMFFVLLPGSNITLEIERLGASHDITYSNGKLVQILMGQGQEKIARDELTKAAKNGGWIIIQNLHLMQRWSKDLEKQLKLVAGSEDLHENFRCFISSEPPFMPGMEIIPESILQNSIKIVNEAPSDLKANIQRAYAHFTQEDIDNCPKPQEFKAILFGLCVFHSLVLGRSKFGPQGWSKNYNFTDNDLISCADVLKSYLAKYDTIPYSDLQYLYGEILYGGHITDCWDRRTNITFVKSVIDPGLLIGMQLTRAPGFKSPDPAKFD